MSGCEKGYWLSMLLVLRDKEGKSGLIVNVSGHDVQSIQLIPTPDSRLALVHTEDSGSALLYFYLQLMDHLRLCGLMTPGPNLAQYAETSGLGKIQMSIMRDELVGAMIGVEGEKVSLDIVSRLMHLNSRIFGDDAVSDDEIIEYIALWPQMPGLAFLLNPKAVFRLSDPNDPNSDGELITFVRPHELIRSAQRIIAGNGVDTDKAVLEQFVLLFRRLKPEGRRITAGIPGASTSHGLTEEPTTQ